MTVAGLGAQAQIRIRFKHSTEYHSRDRTVHTGLMTNTVRELPTVPDVYRFRDFLTT